MATLWQTVVSYLQAAPTRDVTLFPPQRSLPQQRSMSGPLTANELLAIIEGRSTGELSVSEYTALNLSAVWCAVTNIAGSVGKLPLVLYKRRADGGRDKYDEHPLYRILHDEPHPEMGAMVFKETLQQHVLLWGNGYAEILRDGGHRVVGLQLITPNRVRPKRDDRTRALYYDVSNESGTSSRVAASDMLHVRNLSFDGIVGYSVVGKARVTLTLGMQTERFGSSLFANGPKWSGVLQHPKTMSPEAKRALRADLKGLPPGDYPMFEEGITWIQTGMPAKDAEFLSTRQFQVDEIARWFNIPPHKLKELMRATFSNIEHQGIDYLTDTIDPWLVKWEEEVNRKAIAPLERRIQYAEFLRDALTQADLAAKNTSYAMGIQWGWMSRDEVRAKQNMNPIPNGQGKEFLVPANMLPADQVGQEPATPAPEPAPRDDDRAAHMVTAIITRVEDAIQRALPPALPPPPEPAPNPDDEHLRASLAKVAEQQDVLLREIQDENRRLIQAPAAVVVEPPLVPPVVLDEEQIRSIVGAARDPVAQELALIRATAESLAAEVQRALQAPEPQPTPPPAPEPIPPPEPPADEEEEEDAAEAQRHAQIVIAQREIIADVVRRMLTREKDKARAAAKNAGRLRAWLQEFYPRHADVFSAALLPSIRLHVARTSGSRRPEDVVRELVLIHCDESQRGLRAILDRQPADLPADVEALLSRWDIERINLIPDAVMQEEIARHG